jgi:predicted kinase
VASKELKVKLKIWMLQGLQGSGKSTIAAKLIKDNKNTFCVNKDSIRRMTYFEDFNPRHEKMIHLINESLVESLLTMGHNVVVDNMNLGDSNINAYRVMAEKHGADFEVVKTLTPVLECIKRDLRRKQDGLRFVGKDTILNTAFRYGLLRSDKDCVVSDLDGTLCDVSKRRYLVDKTKRKYPDWDEFSRQSINDAPRMDIIEQVLRHQSNGLDLIIVSGCSDEFRDIREEWLQKHGIVPDRFIMRPAKDTRPDTVVKKQFIDRYLDKSKIKFWFDDRVSVINMLKEEKINVIDVGDGTFI